MVTPLKVCKQPDRKGLYAKARAGKVKAVTGITDSYIPPSSPELTIDTTTMTPMEAVQEILLYLEEQGYVVEPGVNGCPRINVLKAAVQLP